MLFISYKAVEVWYHDGKVDPQRMWKIVSTSATLKEDENDSSDDENHLICKVKQIIKLYVRLFPFERLKIMTKLYQIDALLPK